LALYHYVSQVHLRNFYALALGERLYAVRKRDGKAFVARSEALCRLEEGSTNAYLTHDRIIEEFLKTVEPKYNATVAKLGAGQIDQECVYVIAGFAAYVGTCSPAGMRIHAGPMKALLESTALALDAAKAVPTPPESLGGTSLTELLQGGTLKVTVDPKYPQAVGIANILRMTAMFGNFPWEILRNPFDDNPFFTSDFPMAIEDSADPRVLHRIIPLTPKLAIRILPDIAVDRDQCDFSFTHFRSRFRTIERQELLSVNRLLVKCAEELVFYRDDRPWVKPFIARNSGFRIEARTLQIPQPNGSLLISSQRIVSTENNSGAQ
jgi:hypothetical protein